MDLVVHTAGPFQQAEKCSVLEAAIETKVRKGNKFMHLNVEVGFLLFDTLRVYYLRTASSLPTDCIC